MEIRMQGKENRGNKYTPTNIPELEKGTETGYRSTNGGDEKRILKISEEKRERREMMKRFWKEEKNETMGAEREPDSDFQSISAFILCTANRMRNNRFPVHISKASIFHLSAFHFSVQVSEAYTKIEKIKYS